MDWKIWNERQKERKIKKRYKKFMTDSYGSVMFKYKDRRKMANKKKPTAAQMKEQIDVLTRHVNFLSRMIDSVGVAFSSYVRFRGQEEDFKNYLENNKNLHKLTKEENETEKRTYWFG